MYAVQKYHSDWFNKKLSGQLLDRIFREERMLGRRKGDAMHETQSRQDGQFVYEVRQPREGT